ncbi:MAG: rod-binding protein [Pseudomonadota bacterium]
MKILPHAMPAKSPVGSDTVREAATELESVFLAELLKSAGLGKARQAFGGGAGEDQFSSLLVQQQARQLARSGGIGLTEILMKSMMEKTHDG